MDRVRCPTVLDGHGETLRMSDGNVSGVMTYKWLSVYVALPMDSSEHAVTTYGLDVLEIMVRFPAVNRDLSLLLPSRSWRRVVGIAITLQTGSYRVRTS